MSGKNQTAFLRLDGDIEVDTAKMPKSSEIMEFLTWDPCSLFKAPLPVCSLPVEHSFRGSGASKRGNLYVLETVGAFMHQSCGTVKALIFDAHGSHSWVRRLLHGQINGISMDDVREIVWFKELEWEPLPKTCLPRLPIQICRHHNEIVWGIPGTAIIRMGFIL